MPIRALWEMGFRGVMLAQVVGEFTADAIVSGILFDKAGAP